VADAIASCTSDPPKTIQSALSVGTKLGRRKQLDVVRYLEALVPSDDWQNGPNFLTYFQVLDFFFDPHFSQLDRRSGANGRVFTKIATGNVSEIKTAAARNFLPTRSSRLGAATLARNNGAHRIAIIAAQHSPAQLRSARSIFGGLWRRHRISILVTRGCGGDPSRLGARHLTTIARMRTTHLCPTRRITKIRHGPVRVEGV
jgi:hypothetical protein